MARDCIRGCRSLDFALHLTTGDALAETRRRFPQSNNGGVILMVASDFDQVIEDSHEALAEFVKGNPEPLKDMYSHRDDVSLANPFGPPVRGWKEAAAAMERA